MLLQICTIFTFFGFIELAYSKNVDLTKLMQISDKCECSEEVKFRIVGGDVAKEGFYPWMVAIFNHGKLHCGGSIINDRYILTAGHCLNWVDQNDLKVVLGMYDRVLREDEDKGGVEVKIKRLIMHEDFSSDYLHDTDDIALIELEEPLTWSHNLTSVCLPHAENTEQNEALVAGWGRTSQTGGTSRLLRQAKVELMSNDQCKRIKTIGEHITDGMLCAYHQNVDACQGDSGGPLVIDSRRRFEQIGVVSWGIGCARDGVPGVYTRVAEYLEWIVAHTANAIYCQY